MPKDYDYLPVKGSAWRLALARPDEGGAVRLVYGAYDGAVRCQDLSSGSLLWEVSTGAFPFSIAAADLDGDGGDEVLAACADGCLYAIAPDGSVRWTFRSPLPLYNVAAGRLLEDGGPAVTCGGIDRQVYLLGLDGREVARHEVSRIVHRLAVGDLDGDGRDEIFAVDARIYGEVLKLRAGRLEALSRNRLTVPDAMVNWENPRGSFFPFSVATGDLDGDGRDEVVLGDTFFNKQAVMAMRGDGRPLWLSGPEGGRGREFYSTAFVAVAPRLPACEGPGVVSVAGGLVRLFAADGRPLGRASARVGFTDVLVHGGVMYLGSSPNGDDTVYRVALGEGWAASVEALERQGTARAVGEELARLREQVIGYEGDAGPARHYDVQMLHAAHTDEDLAQFVQERDFLCGRLPYDFEWTAGMKVIEPAPPLDEDGRPWSEERWRTDAINGTMTVKEILAAARWAEEHRVPTVALIGHSCMPFVTLETAERMLEAAPDYLRGFLSAEDEQLERIPRYFAHYFGPLVDLCRRHGGRRCTTVNKNVWWMTAPSIREVYEALFAGGRGWTLVAATEDSNSRTPEINLLARFGLYMAGLIDGFRVSIIGDLFSFCRFHQWEYPKHGHPYLRLLAAHTLLGGDSYAVRVRMLEREGGQMRFNEMGRESVEIFFHLLGKGLLFPPAREQVAGMSPVGIAVHTPPEQWLADGHNGHNPERWRDDAELHNAVIPHNGCLWGNTPTPAHALQHVLLGKERQFGCHVPATPYGAFVIVPVHADLGAVPGVHEWWHTDGVRAWQEGGPRLTGMEAAEAMKASFERGAAELTFRPFGHVFFQALRLEEGAYRLYAIDPGWLDPQEREVSVAIQAPGNFKVRDLLSGEPVPVQGGRFRMDVHAGSLRVLEALRR